jgi:hypothetical protein
MADTNDAALDDMMVLKNPIDLMLRLLVDSSESSQRLNSFTMQSSELQVEG